MHQPLNRLSTAATSIYLQDYANFPRSVPRRGAHALEVRSDLQCLLRGSVWCCGEVLWVVVGWCGRGGRVCVCLWVVLGVRIGRCARQRGDSERGNIVLDL